MKVEIDTVNKTIKVLDESTFEDILDMMVELPNYKEYKFIPNTIITTIRVKDNTPIPWTTPSPFTSPTKPWWEQPYTVTF